VSDPKQQDLESVEHVSLWLRERSNDSAPIPLGHTKEEPAQRSPEATVVHLRPAEDVVHLRPDETVVHLRPDETVVHLRPVEDRDWRAPKHPDIFAEAVAKALQEELEPQFVEAPSILQKRQTFGVAARFAAAAGVAALAALVFVVAFPAPQGPEEDASLPTWQSLRASLFPAPQRKPIPTLVVRDSSGPVNESLSLGVNVNSPSPGVTVSIDRIPTGARLTVGKPMGISEWRVSAQEISEASIVPPPDFVGTMSLTAELRGSDGGALVNGVVRLTWTSAATPADPAGVSVSAVTTPAAPAPQQPQQTAVAAPMPQQTAAAVPMPQQQLQQPIASAAPPDAARVEQPVREINPKEVAGFVSRAQELLATGDLQAARLFLLRAAEAHDASAAFALAKTYDPLLSKQFAGAEPEADLAQARNWYRKAQEWGAPEAKRQLEALASFTR
jgi:hypothetical protein